MRGAPHFLRSSERLRKCTRTFALPVACTAALFSSIGRELG
jgi:hypothetical protein